MGVIKLAKPPHVPETVGEPCIRSLVEKDRRKFLSSHNVFPHLRPDLLADFFSQGNPDAGSGCSSTGRVESPIAECKSTKQFGRMALIESIEYGVNITSHVCCP
jgi:hypothetical protein